MFIDPRHDSVCFCVSVDLTRYFFTHGCFVTDLISKEQATEDTYQCLEQEAETKRGDGEGKGGRKGIPQDQPRR